jgi:F-type H+-transporting ATPase subunit delta
MKSLNKDAREFVDGVVKFVKTDANSTTIGSKVAKALSKVTSDNDGTHTAMVESAVAITSDEKSALIKTLKDLFGDDISIQTQVKPDILGGIRITVGDWIYDATLSNHLKQIQSNLIENL